MTFFDLFLLQMATPKTGHNSTLQNPVSHSENCGSAFFIIFKKNYFTEGI